MSVVILGGHERMECRYKEICKKHNCKAKVFSKMPGNLKGKLGSPDLLVLFTGTVSHKLVHSAMCELDEEKTKVARCHSSSACALNKLLEEYTQKLA
ncbi:MAG: DUF2325 domain-containing protein [Oscillospiraceae bacterium]|nr:DUF2325 domain-containing protein [Oscillospiraceae bacterium]